MGATGRRSGFEDAQLYIGRKGEINGEDDKIWDFWT
jgi:hypothetical protein